MNKKKLVLIGLSVFCLSVVSITYSQNVIRLVIDGKELRSDSEPVLSKNRIMVPIRVVAEAFGASVEWDAKNNQVKIEDTRNKTQEIRISSLESALAPETPEEAVSLWAKGVKTRNGALQYAVYSEKLKGRSFAELSQRSWCTGASSPWIEKIETVSKNKIDEKICKFELVFYFASSVGPSSIGRCPVTVKLENEHWYIDSIDDDTALQNSAMITWDDKNNPKIEAIKKKYTDEKIINVTPFNKKYVLIESQKETFANKFELYNLETGDRDELPTMPNFVWLGNILNENEILFWASGKDSESNYAGFPFIIKCSREKEDPSSTSDFEAIRETRYVGLGENVEFGSKENSILSEVTVDNSNLRIVFSPKRGNEIGFYADYASVPPASTEFIQDQWQMVFRFKNCTPDNKLLKDSIKIPESNPGIKKVSVENEGQNVKVIVSLDKSIWEYTCKLKNTKEDGLGFPYADINFR
ncbi:MAG: copper amine oxidase N-terminal domain-containing protein [Clostridia bacterium]|nr:copper amine oxidase N-terminal domain-containing protein [Clostridia bacterium]